MKTKIVITLQLKLKAIYKTLAKVVIKIVITKFLDTQLKRYQPSTARLSQLYMKVNNYDFSCDSFYSSAAGRLKEVGDCGEYEYEAKDILDLEYDDDECEAWADIMFNPSTGKQYAVCGNNAVTASADFYYKELEPEQYIECKAKYLDEFGSETDECLEYLDEEDVVIEEDGFTYKGEDPVIFDDCDNIDSCEDSFEGFYTASGDVNIAAYLTGCRHKYYLQNTDTVFYWK